MFDQATEQEDWFREQAIAAQIRRSLASRSTNHEPRTTINEPRLCSDCGEEIPEARRRALPGVERCVDCQTINERRNMNRGQRPTKGTGI